MGIRNDVLDAWAERIRNQIVHEIVSDDLVFTQQLFNSWEVEKSGEGERIIGSKLLHAKVMDEGRLPGKMPPVAALFPWVSDKMGATSTKEAWSKAWAVAKKIEQNGIEGRHYVKRALLAVENDSR